MRTDNKKLSTEEWIKICKNTHGDTYNYSKSEYINSKTLITITCRKHGDISVNPRIHKNGGGCRKCNGEALSIKNRGKLEDYIKGFKEVHGNKYDYSMLKQFKRNTDKGTFICRKHGIFHQEFRRHLEGVGCEKCSYIDRGNNRKLTYEKLVEKSNKIFGDKFTYCREHFKLDTKNLKITCPIHGEYFQMRSAHFSSPTGCNMCTGKLVRHTTETFIEKAKLIHNDFYDYTKVIYGNSNTDKVTIVCKYHGDFEQAPMGHLGGAGCPTCANIKSNTLFYENCSNIEDSKGIRSCLYLIKFETHCKVGITSNKVKRFRKLESVFGNIIESVTLESSLYNVAIMERDILNNLRKYSCKNLFDFNVKGRTECFNLDAYETIKEEHFTPHQKGEH